MVRITFEEADSAPTQEDSRPSIVLTERAAARVAEILEKKNPAPKYLRVTINGGGCNGFSYNFSFEDTWNPDDMTIEKNGVTVVIDSASYDLMKGSTIDYEETLEASQFVIKNPNATSSCGCGNSFSI